MIIFSKRLFASLVVLLPFSAAAQVVNAPAVTPAPAAVTAPASAPAKTIFEAVPANVPNNPAANFPILPPSRPCMRQDADGLWQLKAVHENPQGVESSLFVTQPFQYLLFLRDDTYRTYSSSWQERSDGVVMNRIREQIPEKLQQYVVHQSGFIFFYVGGAITNTQACFIVVTSNESFITGQMLLMPPEGTSKTRLVKVYQRSESARARARDNNPDEVIQNNDQPRKKRRKRRKPRN